MLKLMVFQFIQFFQLDTEERNPSSLCVLQYFPVLLVNMRTVLHLPVWLELLFLLLSCSGTFAARNLTSLCYLLIVKLMQPQRWNAAWDCSQMHSDHLSLPTLLASWLFFGVYDSESSPSLGTSLTAVGSES